MKSKIFKKIELILKQNKCLLINICIIFLIFFIKQCNFLSIKIKYLIIITFLCSLIIIILIINKYLNYIKNIYKEIQLEIKNISWPTKKDTLNTTFIIILTSLLISFILWGLDTIIFYFISFITSLKY
ncbi:MAG: preprotein translocase subunit SecE [Buchnera aphidicola (Periphyllus acericola)]|uniref:preprotein translocase subunit SecE n=1 Tax=Buchnera aphidicola TaxID=9 RepID=UPI0030CCEFCE|nr:preprotein translocase subunit SecE [Buchnera aphidicola (Periphyllus acericola)]